MSFSDSEGPTRVDRFHAGAFQLHQPATKGFRAGLDAMLLAACVPISANGAAADLGAGTGAVGFGAASRAAGLHATLVEKLPEVAALLRRSLLDPSNEPLAPRLRVIEGDLLGGRAVREAAGLADNAFGLVLSNPPFHPSDHRPSDDAVRRAAMSAGEGDFLRRWARACAALAAPRGRLALIVRPDDLVTVASALAGRMGGIRVLPVHTRPGPARRILLGATKGSREPFAILPGLDLSSVSGAPSPISSAIADGRHHIELFPGGD